MENIILTMDTNFKICEALGGGKKLALFATGYCPLSTYHVAQFTVDGMEYTSIQQYYESEKANFFNCGDSKADIMLERSPKKQQQIGDNLRYFMQEEWDKVKLEVMHKAMKAKADQHAETYDLLMSTEDAVIAEASKFGNGIGVYIKHPNATDVSLWTNDNWYGRLWMTVRYEFQSDQLSGKNYTW